MFNPESPNQGHVSVPGSFQGQAFPPQGAETHAWNGAPGTGQIGTGQIGGYAPVGVNGSNGVGSVGVHAGGLNGVSGHSTVVPEEVGEGWGVGTVTDAQDR